MAIWGCGSLAHCCQPAVAGGFIYADLRSELNTHLAPQAFFTQSSPVHEPLLLVFPFPSTLGEVTLHLLSQASVFIYNSHGKWVFPPLLWSFTPAIIFTSFPAPSCWACAAAPAFSSSLFTVLWGVAPPPPLSLRVPHLLSYMSFVVIPYYSGFFPLSGGQFVQGAMLIWPRVVCGSTTCGLAHLVVCIFPSGLGAGVWLHGSPPGFSI
jgi:hypothetical protein